MNTSLASPDDWESLSDAWRAQSRDPFADAATLRARVARDTRRMHRMVAFELAFTALLVVAGLWALFVRADAFTVLVVADTWLLLALVWAFALWSRRGTWSPESHTIEAYLALCRRRARARLASAYFIIAVVLLQLGIVTVVPFRSSADRAASRQGRTVATITVIAFVAAAAVVRRRARAELRALGS